MTKVLTPSLTNRNCCACLRSSSPTDQNDFYDLLEPLEESAAASHLSDEQQSQHDGLNILTCFNFCTRLEMTSQVHTRFHYMCRDCREELHVTYQFITKSLLSHKHLEEGLKQEQNDEDYAEIDLIEALEDNLDYNDKTDSPGSLSPRHDVDLEKNLAAIFGTDETEFITSDVLDEQKEDDEVSNELNKETTPATLSDDFIEEEHEMEFIEALDDDAESVLEEKTLRGEEDKAHILVKFADSDEEEVVGDAEQSNFEFDCELCTDKYSLQRTLLEHYDKDHDAKDLHFPCELCGSHFVNKNALRIHKRRIHENCVYLDCDQCGRTVLKSFFNLHMRRHKWKLQYLCSKCPNTFTSKHILHKHMAARHTEERVRNIACNDCDRKFFTAEHLQVHRVVHESQPRLSHTCTLCSKSFVRQANLKLHMQMHRGQTMDCTHCGKQFVRRKDLEIHVRFHTGEFPYACGACDKRFAIKSHLTYHERKHAGVRYKCKHCHKVFINISGLKQHSFEHTGMPLSCSVCNRGFPTKFKVRRHLRTVHQHLFADAVGYSDALADHHITTNEVQKLEMKREYIENLNAEEEDSMEMEMLEEHINVDFI